MEAPRSMGELEILVMKYVRSTWDNGRTERGVSTALLVGFGGAEEVELTPLEMDDDVEIVAGFSLAAELWMPRRSDCLLRPLCTIYP